MTEKKTDKKNQHILAINQVLAQFDIETQVRRITVETMDSFMKGYHYLYLEIDKPLSTSKSQRKNLLIFNQGYAKPKTTTKTWRLT